MRCGIGRAARVWTPGTSFRTASGREAGGTLIRLPTLTVWTRSLPYPKRLRVAGSKDERTGAGGKEVEAATRAAGRYEMEEPVRIAVAGRRRERRGPGENRRYSWLEDHLARLDGKEARGDYYAWLG